jgi:hypothetical protein
LQPHFQTTLPLLQPSQNLIRHRKKKTLSKDITIDPIDRLIAEAPDDAIEPEPIKLNPASENPKQKPINQVKAEKENTVEADEFHNDPLIVEALKVFKGRLIS